MPRYVVVLRSSSGVRFAPDAGALFASWPSSYGTLELKFRTRWVDEGFQHKVFRELWIEASGEAPTLDDAIEEFALKARALVPLLALTANAPVDEPEVHLAFDSSGDSEEHEFFENFLPDAVGMPRSSRECDPKLFADLVTAIARSSEADRLHRAATQYSVALTHWRPGHQLLAVAHLWMGIEAVTPVALRRELAARSITRDQLLNEWSVEPRKLDAEVRRRILFRGDDAAYRAALDAATGLSTGLHRSRIFILWRVLRSGAERRCRIGGGGTHYERRQ